MTINFTANFLKTVNIPKRTIDGNFYNTKVSFVELDKNDRVDKDSLKNVSKLWNKKEFNYASEIYYDAAKPFEYDNIVKEHYYAVTTQSENFEKLESEKILGLSLFSETTKPENEINWLQTNPVYKHGSIEPREYKGIGKAIIEYVKEHYRDKNIKVFAADDAINFYKKLGFKNCPMKTERELYLEV